MIFFHFCDENTAFFDVIKLCFFEKTKNALEANFFNSEFGVDLLEIQKQSILFWSQAFKKYIDFIFFP